jgi:hypothetical protein
MPIEALYRKSHCVHAIEGVVLGKAGLEGGQEIAFCFIATD